MPHLDHNAFVNARRDERGVGHHTLRAYAQDLRTFARFRENTSDTHGMVNEFRLSTPSTAPAAMKTI